MPARIDEVAKFRVTADIRHSIRRYGSVTKPCFGWFGSCDGDSGIVFFEGLVDGQYSFGKDPVVVTAHFHGAANAQPISDGGGCYAVIDKNGRMLQIGLNTFVGHAVPF